MANHKDPLTPPKPPSPSKRTDTWVYREFLQFLRTKISQRVEALTSFSEAISDPDTRERELLRASYTIQCAAELKAFRYVLGQYEESTLQPGVGNVTTLLRDLDAEVTGGALRLAGGVGRSSDEIADFARMCENRAWAWIAMALRNLREIGYPKTR